MSDDPHSTPDAPPARAADPDPRIARFEAMVARFPDRSPPRFSLAQALQDAGRHGDAVPHFAEAARLQPDLMMAWLRQAESLVALERYADAEPVAQEALRLALAQGHDGPEADARELLEDIEDGLDAA